MPPRWETSSTRENDNSSGRVEQVQRYQRPRHQDFTHNPPGPRHSDTPPVISEQDYDQSQFSQGYGRVEQLYGQPQAQGHFGGSDFAGSSTQQGYDQSVSEIAAGRRFDLENIAEAYIHAGSHRALPQEYQDEIGRVPFTKQELERFTAYFQDAINNNRIDKSESVRLYNIIRQRSDAGMAARARYERSDAGMAVRKQYARSDAKKAANTKYARSDAGMAVREQYARSDAGMAASEKYARSDAKKAARARHAQKQTDAQVFGIPGAEILDEENFRG